MDQNEYLNMKKFHKYITNKIQLNNDSAREQLDLNSCPDAANFEEIADIELLFNSEINGYDINPIAHFLDNE